MSLRLIILSFSAVLGLSGCGDSHVYTGQSDQNGQKISAVLDVSQGIVGGGYVLPGSRVSRSVVALYSPGFGLCSATLIAPNAVLTAAHCVPKDPTGRVLVIFDTNVKAANPSNTRPVVRMYTSRKWRGIPKTPTNWGDIAIMKFSGSVPSGYVIAPLLPFPKLVASRTMILLSGFGVSDGYAQTGSGILRDTPAMITNAYFSETEVMVDQRDGRGSCNGDSGGPAFIRHNGGVYLWGVVSRGDKNCVKNGIYTNALAYKNWISETLRAD